ncbi:hypothetical protein PBI_SCTP2_46 [Salicola phage SCTP-2]|nr:hypothetical protein PBI_SCTP2_46 [Salicola phage SCTP-2]
MKVTHITQYLFESYKDAQAKFAQEASEEEVKQYLDTFKQLAKKGTVSGQEKDIGYWIKQGWNLFKEFVDSKSQEKSKSQVKKSKKSESIIAHDDDKKIVVIPLSKDSSCYYGKNTKWCTAGDEDNEFANYFYLKNIVLFYVFIKKSGKKYAGAYSQEVDKFEFFNEMDKSISQKQFKQFTSIDDDYLRKLFNEYKQTIMKSMDISSASTSDKVDLIKEDSSLFYELDNVDDDLIYNISKDKRASFRLIYNSYLSKKINSLWNNIKHTSTEYIFGMIDNYLLFSIENMSPANVNFEPIKELFFENSNENNILSFIDHSKNHKIYSEYDFLRNLIWRNAYEYVSDKESLLKESLENDTLRLLVYLIKNDLIDNNLINILESHFSNYSKRNKQIDKLFFILDSKYLTFEKLVDYKIINNSNIDYIAKSIIESNTPVDMEKYIKQVVDSIKSMKKDSINIEFNDQMLRNVEDNLNSYLPLIKLLDKITDDLKLSMIKYIIKHIIGENNKDQLSIFKKSVLEKQKEVLDGLLYPISDELLKDVKDFIKTGES